MINNHMRFYDYYTLATNEYGQSVIGEKAGNVKMAIYLTSQSVQDNILYKGAEYLGLTQDEKIKDCHIIEYGNQKLKITTISPQGRLWRVFMSRMG